MTKPVTAVAVLMVQDGGKLNVKRVVEKYIPEFAALKTPSDSRLGSPLGFSHAMKLPLNLLCVITVE
jgi:CubicO group peptidase (beta-lactamase class C family)